MSRATRLLVFAVLALAGCAAPRAADASAFEADGVFVRHVRVRLAPSHTKAFERLLARCVADARAARLDGEHDWLCYRESPGRYWLLWFSDTAGGFAFPESRDSLASFVRAVSPADKLAELDGLDYALEWTLLLRQKRAWCTVDDVSTATHPKARLMERTVTPGAEAAFVAALTARTAFLAEHGYPLPIEGFVTLAGAPGKAHQVLFPVDWPSFHASTSIGAFVRALDEPARTDYAARKQALMVSMDRAEFYDADHLPALSYAADE